jgi:transposase
MADKHQALLQAGLLYPKAVRVHSPLFLRLPFFDPRDKLQVKYEMLRSHEADRMSITEAADLFAYTRQGFYLVQKAFQAEGMGGLVEKKRGRRGPVKCSPAVVNFVLKEKHAHPELTGRELAARLHKHKGVQVHRRTIEKIIAGLGARGRKKKLPQHP